MPELQPCPFCGKDAQIAPDEIGSGGQHVPPYHAGCFRGAGCGIAFTADDPDEAIAEWNRRPLSTITPAEVGGLVDAQTEARAIETVRDWLNGGCSSWGLPSQQIETLLAALTAKDAELAAERAALRLSADRADRAEAGERAAHDAANTAIRQRDEARAQLAEARKALEAFINRIPAAAWKLPDGALVAKTGIEIEYFRAARRALTAQETRHD